MLVVGAAGQLGEAMAAHFSSRRSTVALTRRELELADAAATRQMVREIAPAVLVNCSGFNQVDAAESRQDDAIEANALAVGTLARAAREVGATFVHYSSDFVFDGETDRPYREDDPPHPRSVYAASKLMGEWLAADAPLHYVLRVESLFGGVSKRKSSLDRIIDSIAVSGPVRVFVDRVVSPSFVWDIVAATQAILDRRLAPGIYHCVNSGAATWHDVAVEVQRQLGTDALLVPVSMADVSLPAARPRYCALSNDKLRAAGVTLPAWQEALTRALNERAATTTPSPSTHSH